MTATAPERGMSLATTEYQKMAEVTGFSSAQINLIRQTVATGASIVEVAWYLYNAKRLGLEPTLDQIYLIRYKQGQPAEIVVGINGYRAQAESSGVYAGSDDAIFEYEDVGQPKGAPSKATVTVWKVVAGLRCPFTASARWEEFYPGSGPIGEQYRKRPHNQLSVRAESHALRKAFPYQMHRLAPQEAPSIWIEAAEADEQRRNDPSRTAALAGRHAEILDSEYEAQDRGWTPAPPSQPVRQEAEQPAPSRQEPAPDPVDQHTIGSKKDAVWQAYEKAAKAATEAGVTFDQGAVKLGMTVAQIDSATKSLLAEVAEAAGAAQEQF